VRSDTSRTFQTADRVASRDRSGRASQTGKPADDVIEDLRLRPEAAEAPCPTRYALADTLLIPLSVVARLLHVSLATAERLKAAARLPRHVALSAGCHRWRRAELEAWVVARCPPRSEWEARHGTTP
jgi:predicted DNA-binding transcriptional regulator AlpA